MCTMNPSHNKNIGYDYCMLNSQFSQHMLNNLLLAIMPHEVILELQPHANYFNTRKTVTILTIIFNSKSP